jgi:hypothetical protein
MVIKRINKLYLVITCFVISLIFSVSVTFAGDIKWLIRAGIDSGGDDLVSVVYDDSTTDEIKAGELSHIATGIEFSTMPSVNPCLRTEINIGWKFDSITASNGSIKWGRYPLEILQFIKLENCYVGAGLTYHINPTLEGSDFAEDLNADFDNALGYLLEAGYGITEGWSLGCRFTFIDYSVNNVDVSGNSVGIQSKIMF